MLSLYLDVINPVFGEMWRKFEPMVFDEDAESVELVIENNNFRLAAEPKFWKKCTQKRKLFIVCHEFCHVIFGHWLINEKLDRNWSNIAQDIQVNEFLIRWYFADQKLGDDFATVKTVFKHKSAMVRTDQDYIYYYNLYISKIMLSTLFNFIPFFSITYPKKLSRLILFDSFNFVNFFFSRLSKLSSTLSE
mgnify:CR=1 FL=1